MKFFQYLFKTLRLLLSVLLLGALAMGGFIAYLWWGIVPDLPSTDSLKDVHLQVPLRVYTADRAPLAEFGEQRRIPLSREEIPPLMVKAILAIEDARFYDHPGVDWMGLARAAVHMLRTGEAQQGGSTITMQLARNMFLTPERKLKRKLKEILLALRMETELSKDEILTLYLNRIFLGNRAYGVGAAAQVYYGKNLKDLTLAQFAMLAGLPKAPSANNPLVNSDRAMIRRNYILKRMLELGDIQEAQYQQAVAEPDTAQAHKFQVDADALYVAEMVRAYMIERFGEEATYTGGYSVITSVRRPLQDAAQYALRNALLEYDRRHGYRGAAGKVALPADWAQRKPEELVVELNKLLADYPVRGGGLLPAVVLNVDKNSAAAYTPYGGLVTIPWKGLSWASRYITDWRKGGPPKTAGEVVQPGEVVYLLRMDAIAPEEKAEKAKTEKTAEGQATENLAETPDKNTIWWLSQVPEVEGALVALDPNSGAILALTGGFDFERNKYNRVTQAKRQPGSTFKPFIYSAALDNGFTPASIINDAPVVYYTPTQVWRPENYSGQFYGPTRLRKALALSRNLVSIRVMDAVGVDKTVDYVTRFGFTKEELPANLTLSLGTPSLTPLQLVRGFAVFANGGYLVEPYFIERIEDSAGQVLYESKPKRVCRDCNLPLASAGLDPSTALALQEEQQAAGAVTAPLEAGQNAPRVISPQNAWLITSMLKDVINAGTATRAKILKRTDLAGKTGTTNEQRDAWFSGYNAEIVATAWVGFDQPRSLGNQETGGRAALPMWIDFMREALRGRPPQELPQPTGLVTARVDAATGLLAGEGTESAISEVFVAGTVPSRYASQDASLPAFGASVESGSPEAVGALREQLF